ncbi:MAG: hypothetical protein ACRD40_02055 [Candidatus Acidiferrales bacterium]
MLNRDALDSFAGEVAESRANRGAAKAFDEKFANALAYSEAAGLNLLSKIRNRTLPYPR